LGALHAGHFALMDCARCECQFVVVSIFVNPTQFGPGEDFERYPRPFERDLEACERQCVDLVFAPEAAEIYPEGFSTQVNVGALGSILEGKLRPTHFAGVCTVVLKLLNIVQPDMAYFGEKDYQQLVVVRRMVADLDLPVRIVAVPTVREADGLALSSRNAYLSGQERARALSLSRGLRAAAAAWEKGERDPTVLCQLVRKELEAAKVVIDYVAAVEAETLKPTAAGCRECVLLVAGRVGTTPLIDNLILGAKGVSE